MEGSRVTQIEDTAGNQLNIIKTIRTVENESKNPVTVDLSSGASCTEYIDAAFDVR